MYCLFYCYSQNVSFFLKRYVRSNGFCKSYVVLEAHGNEQTFFYKTSILKIH